MFYSVVRGSRRFDKWLNLHSVADEIDRLAEEDRFIGEGEEKGARTGRGAASTEGGCRRVAWEARSERAGRSYRELSWKGTRPSDLSSGPRRQVLRQSVGLRRWGGIAAGPAWQQKSPPHRGVVQVSQRYVHSAASSGPYPINLGLKILGAYSLRCWSLSTCGTPSVIHDGAAIPFRWWL